MSEILKKFDFLKKLFKWLGYIFLLLGNIEFVLMFVLMLVWMHDQAI